MELHTEHISKPDKLVKKVLYAAVTPRPIAWVSTISDDGIHNLAPYSFFNAVCSVPPTVMISVGYRDTPAPKDTLANIRANGEFVVNFVTEANADAMNLTSDIVPPDVDEFEVASLTPIPSKLVRPHRVQQSPINFECRLTQIVPINEAPGGGYAIFGTVVYMHVDDAIYNSEKEYIEFDKYQVVGRMAGNDYIHTHDRFVLTRPYTP
jgi:flavin reductase (DIM6/NTAB) family NADH-FMN oxidoreductase RutF